MNDIEPVEPGFEFDVTGFALARLARNPDAIAIFSDALESQNFETWDDLVSALANRENYLAARDDRILSFWFSEAQ